MKYPIFVILILTLFIISPSASETQLKTDENDISLYMREFVSAELYNYPNILEAIKHTLQKLPKDVYTEVTARERPVVFLPTISTGIARYARSHQFLVEPDDTPTFIDGFYLILLGDELNNKNNVPAVSGIIAHEIAHRYLEHLTERKDMCDMEREANRLIKQWGFEKEFEAASDLFGAKKKSDSPCYEEKLPLQPSDES